VSDEHTHDEPETTAARPLEPDPRARPADPVGTRPRFDPASLLPAKPLVLGGDRTLWAPPSEGADDEPEVVHPRRDDEAPAAQDDGDVAEAPSYSRYSHRIQFALGALLAIGVAGVALLVAALIGSGDHGKTIFVDVGEEWSAWRPTATSSGAEAAQQIADHVGKQYRLPNGKQLVLATGGPLEVAGLPVTVAIQQPAAQGGHIDFSTGSGVLYRLCGVGGADCKIAYGRPSVNRAMLLRREALELALYSFRYLSVTQAVVLMPPSQLSDKNTRTGRTSVRPVQTALLFRREAAGVTAAVAHPLSATLSRTTPSVDTVTRSPDAKAVRTLTESNVFNFRFQESNQDARAFLVLSTG
jgi:hypothetical protein